MSTLFGTPALSTLGSIGSTGSTDTPGSGVDTRRWGHVSTPVTPAPVPQTPTGPAGPAGAVGAGSSGGHFFFLFGILFAAAGLLLPLMLRMRPSLIRGWPAPYISLLVSPS
jgi:hypothetical protein